MRPDHMLHLLSGSAIASFAALATLALNWPAWGLWGALAAALSGLAKEAWDSLGNGKVEASDALWTVAGAAPSVALWVLWTI